MVAQHSACMTPNTLPNRNMVSHHRVVNMILVQALDRKRYLLYKDHSTATIQRYNCNRNFTLIHYKHSNPAHLVDARKLDTPIDDLHRPYDFKALKG